MKHIVTLTLLVLLAVLGTGCGSAPVVREQPQWKRILTSARNVPRSAKMKVTVSGSTVPLLGTEQLVSDSIRAQLTALLKRRGYGVETAAADYTAKLSYATERNEKARTPSGTVSSTLPAEAILRGTGASRGLGVNIADAVSALVSRSTAAGGSAADLFSPYTHAIAIEIRDRDGAVVWKGESTWDANDVDILPRLAPTMRALLSDLPADSSVRPAIREIRDTHIAQYYLHVCTGVSFDCPALPYSVQIDYAKINPNSKIDIPKTIHDPYALAAYVDLLQSAEYALPSGSEDEWKVPTKTSLWKRVTLGGQYVLGKEKKPINILVRLLAGTNGYALDDCAVVSDEEYAKFSGQLSKWKLALKDYYDVFAQ